MVLTFGLSYADHDEPAFIISADAILKLFVPGKEEPSDCVHTLLDISIRATSLQNVLDHGSVGSWWGQWSSLRVACLKR